MDNTITRTDVAGKTVVERRHISFSALDKFANCPRKFYHYDVVKDVSEPENPNMNEGFRVHKAMADYISNLKPLPDEYVRFGKWAENFLTSKPDKVLTEHKLAMTYDLRPCEYFSRRDKVWLRAQADLLLIKGADALSVDWKTGKEPDPRYELLPPNFQLRLTALLIFLHFPKIENVVSKYVYLNADTSTSFDMPKSDLREFIPQLYDVASGLQRAVKSQVWQPRPSGLCKKYCAVKTCEYWGVGNSRG